MQGFVNNEDLIVEVDINKLPSVVDVSDEKLEELTNEMNLLKAANVGCDKELATKITVEYVFADGDCLFHCANLALLNTVSSP